MKGKRKKRKKGQFAKGHESRKGLKNICDSKKSEFKRTYLRLQKDVHDKIIEVPRSEEYCIANDGTQDRSKMPVLLRPKADDTNLYSGNLKKDNNTRDEQDTYRLVHLEKLSEMWNFCFYQHKEYMPQCKGKLIWDTEKEQQRGFVWRANLKCVACTYQSYMYNLYKELPSNKRGPNPAAINYGTQVGLSQVSIGSSGLRKVLLSSNIPAPSTKGMQNTANEVNKEIVNFNKQDMSKLRNDLKTINKSRGHPENAIDIECDGCYNNPPYSGVNKTPFQPDTQCCYVLVENQTDKQVINLVTKNKLCSFGKTHTGDELHEKNCECSQNMAMTDNIGNEEKSAYDGLKVLYEEGFAVRNITTDPDTSAYRAAEKLAEENACSITPSHFLDTRHFSENQRKFRKRNEKIQKLMPGKTKAEREQLLSKFATDLSARCHAEYESALKECGGSVTIFKRALCSRCNSSVLSGQSYTLWEMVCSLQAK